MLKSFLLALLRHGLTAAGGALVAKGTLSSDEATQLVGAGLALGGLAASWVDKKITASEKASTAAAVAKLNS
jgi:hypothetical protein